MNSITKSMAKTYFGPHGIRTNVVAPGWVETKMIEEYVDLLNDFAAMPKAVCRSHHSDDCCRITGTER